MVGGVRRIKQLPRVHGRHMAIAKELIIILPMPIRESGLSLPLVVPQVAAEHAINAIGIIEMGYRGFASEPGLADGEHLAGDFYLRFRNCGHQAPVGGVVERSPQSEILGLTWTRRLKAKNTIPVVGVAAERIVIIGIGLCFHGDCSIVSWAVIGRVGPLYRVIRLELIEPMRVACVVMRRVGETVDIRILAPVFMHIH